MLNKLAWAAQPERKGRSINLIVGGLLALCMAVCAWMSLGSIDRKFVLMIDAIELGGAGSVTVGHGSDVSVKSVPRDFMTISLGGEEGARWTMNDRYRDSLQYFKINGLNPNLHEVLDSEAQKIEVVLMPYVSSMFTSSTSADYGRTNRRLMLYSNFDHLQQLGYRYTESDAEFMVIMSHYMQESNISDPLSNDLHPQ